MEALIGRDVARGMYRGSPKPWCSRLTDLFNHHGENVVLAYQSLELEPAYGSGERPRKSGREGCGANHRLAARLGDPFQTADDVHRRPNHRKIQARGTADIAVHHWANVQGSDEGGQILGPGRCDRPRRWCINRLSY